MGEQSTDVHVIEIKKMETGKVALNLTVLTEDLDSKGYVVVEGIYFDSDKTTLKSESKPALNEVANLLRERANLSLYVVGHTDTEGSFSHNMSLSKGRANAVETALITDYGIPAQRLEGRGVGPLAPVDTNGQESGRAKNRRLVMVQR